MQPICDAPHSMVCDCVILCDRIEIHSHIEELVGEGLYIEH